MIYPRNFEEKIEFDAIRDLVSSYCISPMGVEHVSNMRCSSSLSTISRWLDETAELSAILEIHGNFPAQDYFDMRQELSRIRIEGSFIGLKELFDLKTSLNAIVEVVKYITHFQDFEIPSLRLIAGDIYIDDSLLPAIENILDEKGSIRDHASNDLRDIRLKLINKENSLNRKIAQNLKAAKQAGWVSGDTEITIREGRQVIPLPASHKRRIKGVILDESATGQTVFIEPGDVLEVNNAIRELKSAERREIVRILKKFTDEIRPHIPDLIKAYEALGRFDFIRAKARFNLKIKGRKPKLKKQQELNWIDAIHPLLYLSHKKQKKLVVPLTIQLDDQARILVISGPNAGGKSVCLKTVGLLQYMLQCGFPIPVKEGSASGIFKNLFIDIGDEQSLENDLSTYSSHLLNMKNLVLKNDGPTLFLIDEFGTGTEPRLGGAIAEVILEKLNQKLYFGVVTTHYSNLKLLAKEGNGIINGAMLYDTKKMEPLYELAIGKPGSSFAFEIARKIGFPKDLLNKAEEKTGKKQLDFDQQLQQLDIENRELEKKQLEFKVADSFLSEMIEKYENLKNDLESQKRKIIADAKEEALQLIESSNKMIEHTIKEIRESGAEKKKTLALRKKLWTSKDAMKNQIAAEKEKTGTQKEKKETASLHAKQDDKLRIGDTVMLPEQDIRGEVLSISGDEVVIGFNSISFRTQISKVQKTKPQKKKGSQTEKRSSTSLSDQMNDKLASFGFQLDVRGMRGDEALEKVRHYIDDAILLNMKEVKILHGKGHGILRSLIHDYLKGISEIKKFRDEHIERGGHGITMVILK